MSGENFWLCLPMFDDGDGGGDVGAAAGRVGDDLGVVAARDVVDAVQKWG